MNKEKILNVLKCIPLQNTIIFESSPDLSDSPYYLFKYLVEKHQIHKHYKLVWFILDDENAVDHLCGVPVTCVNHSSSQKGFMTRLKRLYYNYTAKAIIDSNMFVYKKRPGQVRIFTDHGMPLKDAAVYQSGIGDVDLMCVSGDFFVDIFAKYTDRDSIRVYGLPRDEEMYDLVRENVQEKKILWMPTYRQHKGLQGQPANIFPLGIPVIKTREQLAQVNEKLRENNMKLMLRLHPAQDVSVLGFSDMSNIVLADNAYLKAHRMMLEDLLKDSDALITDYSSVYYDYLFADRPIGLTLEDVEIYKQTMDLVFEDLNRELPGKKMLQTQDLLDFIDEVKNGADPCRQARGEFMKRMGMEKMPSCRLIGDFLMEKLGK